MISQAETHADFAYSLSGDVISIVDLNLGNRSLTNDIESVLRKIEHHHQGSIVGFKIMYRDFVGISTVRAALVFARWASKSAKASLLELTGGNSQYNWPWQFAG